MIAADPDQGLLRARHARALILAGESGSAQSEIARAIELGPRQRILDWLLQRAEDFRASGRSADALRLLDPAIAAAPDGWLAYALRAKAFAALGRIAEREADLVRAVERGADIPFLLGLAEERSRSGRWASAADLYDQAIARGTIPHEDWQHAAIAHLMNEDEAGFRRVCQVVRSRYPAAIPEGLLELELASTSILGPGGVGEDGKVRTWADDFLAVSPSYRKERRHSALNILGGILYRSGRFPEAIDRIHEGMASQGGEMMLEDAIFLAMAYHKLGDFAKAREMLARQNAEEIARRSARFWDAQALGLLRRESERLILDSPFPDDPFAH